MPKRLFISYSHISKPTVEDIADAIERNGYIVWFDQELSGGQAWWDQICEWIEECDIFVFALDENSLDSNACEIEWGYTDKLGKPILPVKISKNVSTTLIH